MIFYILTILLIHSYRKITDTIIKQAIAEWLQKKIEVGVQV